MKRAKQAAPASVLLGIFAVLLQLVIIMQLQEQLKKAFVDEEKGFDEIIGQDPVKQHLKSALMAGRHMLIVGPPGIGKTTLAKNVAKIRILSARNANPEK
ncbi:ATP-binding protein [archaeon]|nr:ATP-binding protein [archaeon]